MRGTRLVPNSFINISDFYIMYICIFVYLYLHITYIIILIFRRSIPSCYLIMEFIASIRVYIYTKLHTQPPRKNASTEFRGSSARAKIVRYIKKNSMEQWKENNSYGKRWLVEIYFSGLKRVMSEVIKAKKIEYIIQELALKVVNYNIMRGMTHAY